MNIRTIVGVAMIAASLGGCATSIKTRPLVDDEPAPAGYPYRLKFNQYDVKVTWTVSDCQPGPDPLKIKISADFTGKTAFDPDRFYLIDVRSLSGLFKASEANLEYYPDRTLKAINASVDDQTGTVIANVATGVGKLAAASLAAAGPTGCDEGVAKKLPAVGAAKKAVEDQEKIVATKTITVARATSKSAALGAAIDDHTRTALSTAISELEAETLILATQKTALETAQKDVTFSQNVVWPQKGSDKVSDPVPLPKTIVDAWGLHVGQSKDLTVYLALTRLETVAQPDDKPPEVTRTAHSHKSPPPAKPQTISVEKGWRGLPYREPVWGRLQACSRKACGTEGSEPGDKTDALFLQLGPMLLLPFEGKPFAAGKASASFTENGVLQTAGLVQTRSAAAGASEAFKAGAEQAALLIEKKNAAPTAKLEAETNRLKAEKALADAKGALLPPADAETKKMEAETARLKAEKALADATAALQSVPDDARTAQLNSFQIDLALAQAETSLITANEALAVARAQRDGQ